MTGWWTSCARASTACCARGTPRDSTLIARKLASMPQVVCASPDYLARVGTPRHPDDLPWHQTVRFFASGGGADYPLELTVDGQLRRYPLPGWISVNDAQNYVASALRGCGLIQVPRFHIEQELADGRLVEVLSDWESPAMTLSALYPQHRQLRPRVRCSSTGWRGSATPEKFPAPPTAA